MLPDSLRRTFWYVKRYFMVPMFRLGLDQRFRPLGRLSLAQKG